ncbi:MAG: galactokinase [Chitinophagales bacterium]|nr:galactokinase [Chitinophagales bacterium]
MHSKESIQQLFQSYYGEEGVEWYFSPGRVNVIGEHIDYNGGYVMPIAINYGVSAMVKRNSGNVIRIYAHDFQEELHIQRFDKIPMSIPGSWKSYVTGMLTIMQRKGIVLDGLDMLMASDLPIGAGLSSSAALECLIGYVFAGDYYDEDRTELAKDAQQAEHEFAGVMCGIMDQFAVACGKINNAMLLDCQKISCQYIPFDLGNYRLMVINSNKPRALADSKYNERLAECRKAMELLRFFHPVSNLVDVSSLSLAYLEDDTLYARAKHVISENNRVKLACNALLDGDILTLGQLMLQSHESLDEDYEVAGDELNTLIEYAMMVKECIGARMTGAGFGGCCIALVESGAEEKFSRYLRKKYKEKTGLHCEVFAIEVCDGVGRMDVGIF